ncbi:unnamed protein product [Chrysoparadoxa australica]
MKVYLVGAIVLSSLRSGGSFPVTQSTYPYKRCSRQTCRMAVNLPVEGDTAASLSRLEQARARLQEATGAYALPHGGQLDDITGLRKQTRVRELDLKVAEPEERYNPEVLELQLFQQPTRWLVRNVQLFVPFARFAAALIADFQSGNELKNRKKRAEQLLDVISGLGPAIIKAGQALSSRPDLLPSEYLLELQKLQDRLPPFSSELAFATVEEEFGVPFDEIYELVEPLPIAAASIGQVYKARLRSNGHLVAIKVQRPHCQETIALDLYIMRWYSGIINQALRWLNRDIDLQSIIDDFGELIYRLEIDYRAEMVNCLRFAELYLIVPNVFVPKVYSELTSKKVLTMEWVEGARLVDKEALAGYGLEGTSLVDTLVQCSLRQMLENGFFHADPHAGNLLATPDGQLCFLDFGMVSYVEAQQRYGIIEAVVHLVNRDFRALANLYKRLGFIPPDQDIEPIVEALADALPDVLSASVSELNFKNVINELGEVFYKYPFSLPPYYIAIIRCLGVLEGVAIQADPEFKIISDAYPYIASRLLTDSAPELQSALQQLLFKDGKARWERFEDLLKEAQTTRDYDVMLAINQMIDYLISPAGEPIRMQLTEEAIEGMDQLGVETLEFLTKNVGQLSVGNIPALLRGDRKSIDNIISQEELTPAMESALRIIRLVSSSEGFEAQKILPLLRRLLREPEAQVTSVQLATSLSERAVSRAIRALFRAPESTGQLR